MNNRPFTPDPKPKSKKDVAAEKPSKFGKKPKPMKEVGKTSPGSF